MAFEYLAALETMIFTVCPKNKSPDVLSYEHNLFKISKLREKTTARCLGLYIVLTGVDKMCHCKSIHGLQ